ncbi:MAG: putative zinc-binding metallopeptidase [Candidatus Latescibacterota bacterium]|jgi:hypothetical protein
MKRRTRRTIDSDWAHLTHDRLLDLRIKDLDLSIESTWLERQIQQLYEELDRRGLKFRPHCWLGTEWFSPNRVPGIGIPFYLAHPRLRKLEDRMMLEVEGGSRAWCMQLLRHECGHAYETAYVLGRRKIWRKTFGRPSKPYPVSYRPRPVSKRYVLHLDWWYAQSHPCEDFAETFAVWLRPRSPWRRRYRDWPALKKLEYVDELMDELSAKRPLVRSRAHVDPASKCEQTLREYYNEKQARYESDRPDFYDRDLTRLFPTPYEPGKYPTAAAYLRRTAPEIRSLVAEWTGEHAYTVNLVIKDMIKRCRELGLLMTRPHEDLRIEVAVMLTMQTMNFVHGTEHLVTV